MKNEVNKNEKTKICPLCGREASMYVKIFNMRCFRRKSVQCAQCLATWEAAFDIKTNNLHCQGG